MQEKEPQKQFPLQLCEEFGPPGYVPQKSRDELIAELLADIPKLKSFAHNWIDQGVEPGADEFCRNYTLFRECYQMSSGVVTNEMGASMVLALFKAAAPWSDIVDDSEYRASLPETMVVYRGGPGPIEQLRRGISWTARKDTGKRFGRLGES